MPDTVTLKVGDKAPDAIVQGEGSEAVRLSSLWHDGVVALVFLRHFG